MKVHELSCCIWACMQFPELAWSSMSLHEVPWACMQFHELSCSFMSLNTVPFFVWAAHKNFAVLVFHGFDLLTVNILEQSGIFWKILEHSGTFWKIRGHSGTFWKILGQSGTFWNILVPPGKVDFQVGDTHTHTHTHTDGQTYIRICWAASLQLRGPRSIAPKGASYGHSKRATFWGISPYLFGKNCYLTAASPVLGHHPILVYFYFLSHFISADWRCLSGGLRLLPSR